MKVYLGFWHRKHEQVNWRFGPKGAAASHTRGERGVGGGTSVGGWHIPGGGCLTLVFTWLIANGGGGMIHWEGSGGGKAKVLLLPKPLELQYYFAPFSKAAK